MPLVHFSILEVPPRVQGHLIRVLFIFRAVIAGMDVRWFHGNRPLLSRGAHLSLGHSLLLWPWGHLPQHSRKVSLFLVAIKLLISHETLKLSFPSELVEMA